MKCAVEGVGNEVCEGGDGSRGDTCGGGGTSGHKDNLEIYEVPRACNTPDDLRSNDWCFCITLTLLDNHYSMYIHTRDFAPLYIIVFYSATLIIP
jgi:hypothetical protein